MNKHYHKYKEGYKKRAAKWRKENPERVKENGLKFRHGMSIKDYNKLFEKQNGCCVICGRSQTDFKRKFVVDHSHLTNKNRGLLCYSCNTAVGRVETLPKNIEKIISYLGEFRCLPFQIKNIKLYMLTHHGNIKIRPLVKEKKTRTVLSKNHIVPFYDTLVCRWGRLNCCLWQI